MKFKFFNFNRFFKIFFCFCFIFQVYSSISFSNDNSESLKLNIDKILGKKCSDREKIGIKVVNLTQNKTVYELNSSKLFVPASNTKIITSATALKKLKPDYRFKTKIFIDGVITNGVLDGNLYIKGYGDPRLVSEELWLIVKDIYGLGIRKIDGHIVGDNTYFDNIETGKGWGKRLSSRAYHAKVSALSLNFNSITVNVFPADDINGRPIVTLDPDTGYADIKNNASTIILAKTNELVVDRVKYGDMDRIVVSGKISKNSRKRVFLRNISNPKNYFLTSFRKFLVRFGIEFDGEILSGIVPEDARELLIHKSKTLGLIVRDLNKMSNNFVAEQILKTIGAEFKGEPGTTLKGIEVVSEFLEELDIPKDSYTLSDGSGLSTHTKVSPDILIKILRFMYSDFSSGSEFIASLGVMGTDGSLKDRLKKTKARRMVRAKTGTLNGVVSLSGYLKSKSGDVYAFSLLTNGIPCYPYKIMRVHDRILLDILNL